MPYSSGQTEHCWNECPDTRELMAVTKYWFEKSVNNEYLQCNLFSMSGIVTGLVMGFLCDPYGGCEGLREKK